MEIPAPGILKNPCASTTISGDDNIKELLLSYGQNT